MAVCLRDKVNDSVCSLRSMLSFTDHAIITDIAALYGHDGQYNRGYI